MRLFATSVLLIAGAIAGLSQVATTSRMDGTVTDSQGAAVPGAQVIVSLGTTSQKFQVSSDEKGYWAIPSLPSGIYQVRVTKQGFKTAANDSVKLDAGVPATVNVTLEVGALTETIQVSAGAEVVQADTATIASTLQGTQIHDLPFTSHNVTELIATQPGTQAADGVRYSTVNGLPQSQINVTIDGINIQDNTNRSTDAIFNNVQPRTEAIEEMTMTTAAAGAESSGEGAVQIRFVTKSGSNQFHGLLFETNRNQKFEADYFFNSLAGLPKDKLNLNEYGWNIGGPIKKNKLFFFHSFEFFDLPQSFNESGNWLTPLAATGVFTYNAGGAVKSVNLFQLAQAGNASLPANVRPFPTAVDPTLAKTYSLINQLTSSNGTLANRIANNNDYNRNTFTWGPVAVNNRKFETARIDYNLTEKHHINFVWNYQINDRTPDGLNGTLAILPGTGTQLGATDLDGQYGINWTGTIGVRSVLTPNLTNEFTGGIQGGTNALGAGMSPADYSIWNGRLLQFGAPSAGLAASTFYMSNPYTGSYLGYAPRGAPVYQISDNLTYLKKNHLINFGRELHAGQLLAGGLQFVAAEHGHAGAGYRRPDNTGATSLFTTNTLPGASATQLSDAANLYAILAGRVSAVTSSAVLNEQTKTYGPNYAVDRDHMRVFALFVSEHGASLPTSP